MLHCFKKQSAKAAKQDLDLAKMRLNKILDVPQPRVRELLNGKLSGLSIEKLLTYLEKLGIATTALFKLQKAS